MTNNSNILFVLVFTIRLHRILLICLKVSSTLKSTIVIRKIYKVYSSISKNLMLKKQSGNKLLKAKLIVKLTKKKRYTN